jgi:DNA-binding NarL/FixJ family response regulator
MSSPSSFNANFRPLRRERPAFPGHERVSDATPPPDARLRDAERRRHQDAALESQPPGFLRLGAVRRFADVWLDLAAGHVTAVSEWLVGKEMTMILRDQEGSNPSGMNSAEIEAFGRVLCGEQQKLVASEMGRSRATICTLCSRAQRRLQIEDFIPTAVIVAAQCHGGIAEVTARLSAFEKDGVKFGAVTIPRLTPTVLSSLTAAETEVAQLLVEGYSKRWIAQSRGTALHTVTTQAHSIFAKTGSTGRYALIRKIVGLTWPLSR